MKVWVPPHLPINQINGYLRKKYQSMQNMDNIKITFTVTLSPSVEA